jgi:hypothetical protein
MNDEEVRSTIEQIKAQVKAKPENKDKTDDEIDELILDAFYKAYTDGKMSKEDLGGLAQAMGYEFTEEFDQDPEAVNELTPEGGDDNVEAPESDLEAVRTMEPGESAEEFKEKVEDVKEGKPIDDENSDDEEVKEEEVEEDDDDDEEEDEDEERKKASELWKLNLNK